MMLHIQTHDVNHKLNLICSTDNKCDTLTHFIAFSEEQGNAFIYIYKPIWLYDSWYESIKFYFYLCFQPVLTSEQTKSWAGFTTTWVSRTSPLCCRVRWPAGTKHIISSETRLTTNKTKQGDMTAANQPSLSSLWTLYTWMRVYFSHVDSRKRRCFAGDCWWRSK